VHLGRRRARPRARCRLWRRRRWERKRRGRRGRRPRRNGVALTLAADPGGDLAFGQTSLEAAAGTVTITFTNESGVPHNVAIEGNGVDEVSETIMEGSTELTVDLEPGEYTFYCGVGGHRAGGMEGTLTVT
jgi:plastocyanin